MQMLPALAAQQRESLAGIHRVQAELDNARERLAFLKKAAEGKRIAEAREANAAIPKNRVFEVKSPRGEILRHRAASAAQLTGELQFGYSVVAECFGYREDGTGGISVSLDANTPSFFEGFISAFGPQLLLWLSENRVQIRRGDAA